MARCTWRPPVEAEMENNTICGALSVLWCYGFSSACSLLGSCPATQGYLVPTTITSRQEPYPALALHLSHQETVTLTPALSGRVMGTNLSWSYLTSWTDVLYNCMRGKTRRVKAVTARNNSLWARLDEDDHGHTVSRFSPTHEEQLFTHIMPRHARLPLENDMRYFSKSLLRLPSSSTHLSGTNSSFSGKTPSLW